MRKIVHTTKDFFQGDPHKREDFKRQLRLLIIVTLGFTIAFSWRQTIFDAFLHLAKIITHLDSNTTLSIIASILITLVSIILIYLAARLMPDNPVYR